MHSGSIYVAMSPYDSSLSVCLCPCLKKMRVKIIKNEVRYRDDTISKTVDTRRHCKVGLRACNSLLQLHPYILIFRGCVSTIFGTVSSLHLACQIHSGANETQRGFRAKLTWIDLYNYVPHGCVTQPVSQPAAG